MSAILKALAEKGLGTTGKKAVRPLFKGPLVYVDPATGDKVPILQLEDYPREPGKANFVLTPRVAEQYVRARRGGNTLKCCAALCGVTSRHFSALRTEAEEEPEESTPYQVKRRRYLQSFFRSVDLAWSLAEIDLLEVVQPAAFDKSVQTKTRTVVKEERGVEVSRETTTETVENPPDFRAAMWLLGLRESGSYAPKSRVEITGEDGQAVKVEQTASTGILGAIHDTISRMAENRAQSLPAPSEPKEDVQDAEYTVNEEPSEGYNEENP